MANTRADRRAAIRRAAGPSATLVAAFAAGLLPAQAAEPGRPAVAATAAATPAPAARALPTCAAGGICFRADDIEYRRDRVVLHVIVIYQSDSPLRVEAQSAEASSLDFTDSTWTLTGEVRMRTEQGELAADKATVHFSASRLGDALATGTPASFEQVGETEPGHGARGHAREIDYDPRAGEVRLTGEAWLTDGCNETSSERIVYEFAQQRVHAQGAAGARVQGTIRPQCKPARPPGGGTGSGGAPAGQSGAQGSDP